MFDISNYFDTNINYNLFWIILVTIILLFIVYKFVWPHLYNLFFSVNVEQSEIKEQNDKKENQSTISALPKVSKKTIETYEDDESSIDTDFGIDDNIFSNIEETKYNDLNKGNNNNNNNKKNDNYFNLDNLESLYSLQSKSINDSENDIISLPGAGNDNYLNNEKISN